MLVEILHTELNQYLIEGIMDGMNAVIKAKSSETEWTEFPMPYEISRSLTKSVQYLIGRLHIQGKVSIKISQSEDEFEYLPAPVRTRLKSDKAFREKFFEVTEHKIRRFLNE